MYLRRAILQKVVEKSEDNKQKFELKEAFVSYGVGRAVDAQESG